MTTTPGSSPHTTRDSPAAAVRPPTGRLFAGSLIFVLGFACPAFVPLVVRSGLPPGWKTTLSALLVLGIPEVVMIAAAAILGESGYRYVKARIKRTTLELLAHYGPPETVGRTRYRIGLFLFAVPLLVGWAAPYALHHLPGYESHPLIYALAGDVIFVASLFVLGGEFWDKLRSLFVHGAKVRFPGPTE